MLFVKSKLLGQLKSRRKFLGMTQEDMTLRVGMGRQQYQRLESDGNPRLDTLELIAKGLKMELMLIPQEKVRAVRDVLNDGVSCQGKSGQEEKADNVTENPWKDLLDGDE